MNKLVENNQVTINGEIVSGFDYSYDVFGEHFYMVYVKVERLSLSDDIIPVTVSDRLVDVSNSCVGQFVTVTGQFRSYNKQDGDKKRLVLSVFAQSFDVNADDKECSNANSVYLDGYICKNPVYRETPLGREITDIFLAANRPYGKSDYIPCVCWGRNARYAGSLSVGQRISLCGRIQSREYNKKLGDNCFEKRIAYEVSVSKLEVRDED